MPQTHIVPRSVPVYLLTNPSKNATEKVHVLERTGGQVYVHYVGKDKRLDEWVPEDDVSDEPLPSSKKRKRGSEEPEEDPRHTPRQRFEDESEETTPFDPTEDMIVMTEEDFDIEHHKKITAHRNFDKVNFAEWQIKTWYYSPYPLTETEDEGLPASTSAHLRGTPRASSHSEASTPQPGQTPAARGPLRSHPRTLDLLTGGLGRSHGATDSILWVCDKCFKYMVDGYSWEWHLKKCTMTHPPGRKVYQRGAHIIWEVDGAKEKLYCQNLSLFGKLFIDVKTLFFDTENFMFYLLTDADSQRDHVLGFFSKEKLSYDAYNLACIITLPPFQRKGFGMLMIEFSYELSRRAGEKGTPERPLSDLGLRSYLTYWVAVLVRYLRRLLSVLPPEIDLSSPLDAGGSRKRKKSAKGWDGESSMEAKAPPAIEDPLFKGRKQKLTANSDGSARADIVVECTLDNLADAVGLRVEDAAFALNEVGLLRFIEDTSPSEPHESNGTAESATPSPTRSGIICISREMVEAVAKEKRIKRPCMDLARVLL